MTYTNSQEQTVYRRLASQIQLGFYEDGERFPSAQEIARRYQISYCPAQRALKLLENDGLIRLCRGKETSVLRKPYDDYLNSTIFFSRIEALDDLNRSLKLISSPICFQGLCAAGNGANEKQFMEIYGCAHPGKRLYRLFVQALRALGSRSALNLYYDIGAFTESAFLDILNKLYGENGAELLLSQFSDSFLQSMRDCRERRLKEGRNRLNEMQDAFFEKTGRYFEPAKKKCREKRQTSFLWEPNKGRNRYCDVIAVDLLRKIGQGIHPVGTLFPSNAVLADIYHVSEMTIRRTVGLMNQLGVSETRNGVGTRVVSEGDESTPYKMKSLMSNNKFICFLEALQLLAITGKPVLAYTFPHCPAESLGAISRAAGIKVQYAAVNATVGALLQAAARHCPLAAIREIYSKITLLLLFGSILQIRGGEYGRFPGWPEISRNICESLEEGDGVRLAASADTLFKNCFAVMKEKLLELGIAGADKVYTPFDI